MRIFLSVEIPKEVKRKLEKDFLRKLPGTGLPLKIVKPENLHLTLKFLGEINKEELQKVYDSLREIKKEPFKIELRGTGAFPSSKRPRIIWLGVEEGKEELMELALFIEDELFKAGFPKEERRFAGHLTVARIKGYPKEEGLRKLTKLFEESSEKEFGSFLVQSFYIMESVLQKEGPTYALLKKVDLAE